MVLVALPSVRASVWGYATAASNRGSLRGPRSACNWSIHRYRGRASKRRAWDEPEKRVRLENNRGHALASRSLGGVGMRERAHPMNCAGHCAMKFETRHERRERGRPSASLSSSRESSSSRILTSPQQASSYSWQRFRPQAYYPLRRQNDGWASVLKV